MSATTRYRSPTPSMDCCGPCGAAPAAPRLVASSGAGRRLSARRWRSTSGRCGSKHGTLLVEVDDPAWATQVRYLADDITARLAEVSGVTVERLDVRVRRPRR